MSDLKQYFRENKIFCTILILFSVMLFCILLMFNFKGHDYSYHLQRIGSIAEEIKFKGLGAFPIRIYSTNEYNYGYASPLFYGDILLYPVAILSLLGLNAVYGYRIMLVVLYSACFFNMYYCTKQISKNVQTSIICAVIYAFSSYFALDLFVRSALGECFAFVFLPLACYGYYCTIINPDMPKKHRLFLVFGMAGLLLTHLISTTLIAIFMVIFGLVYYKNWIKNPKILINFTLLALLTAALCAFFVFPLLEQMLTAKFYTTEHTLYQFEHWKLRWASWIGPHAFWKLQGDRFPQLRDGLWFAGGFGWMLVTLIAIWGFNAKKLKNQLMVSLLAASLILILMAQGLIIPLNKLQKVIGFMQFSYRILLICTLFMSIFGAYAVHTLKNKKINMLLLIVSIISCMLIVVTSYKIIHKECPSMTNEYTLTTDQIGKGEYIPNELVESLSDTNFSKYCQNRGNRVDVNHRDVNFSHSNDEHGKIELTFSGNHYDDTAFELPLLMYKGYSAVNEETGEKYDVSASEHGLVNVNVGDEQSGKVIVRYTGTIIQHISDVISILTIILLLIYFFKPDWLFRLKETGKNKLKILSNKKRMS